MVLQWVCCWPPHPTDMPAVAGGCSQGVSLEHCSQHRALITAAERHGEGRQQSQIRAWELRWGLMI